MVAGRVRHVKFALKLNFKMPLNIDIENGNGILQCKGTAYNKMYQLVENLARQRLSGKLLCIRMYCTRTCLHLPGKAEATH